VITVLAVVFLALGLAGVLRAVAVVGTGGAGRFPLDPWISLLVGFGLILLGQALLGRS
jgi:hypothetical protein